MITFLRHRGLHDGFSPVHESKGQEGGDAVRGHHEHDPHDLALLSRLHKIRQMQHNLKGKRTNNAKRDTVK